MADTTAFASRNRNTPFEHNIMKQLQPPLQLCIVVLQILLCLWSGGVDAIRGSDHCQNFVTCASCTAAHFRSDDEILVSRTIQNESSSSSSSMEAITTTQRQRQLLAAALLLPHRRPNCVWCPLLLDNGGGTCRSNKSRRHSSNQTTTTPYEFDCPLAPTPYPDEPPSILPNWMGLLVNASGGKFPLTDLSLPGTHDSLTYDLSLTVSDDGLDGFEKLADFLHIISGGGGSIIHLLPGDMEEFFRLQAKTQQLSIEQQLDNGIRFIDFRMMMQKDSKEWYSIHFMQSKRTVHVYWNEIRQWLDDHPQEIIILWLSKHGNPQATGDDQYPGVTKEEKKKIWTNYQNIFEGMLFDASVSDIHETPLAVLLQRNHRVITFATDYDEFTQSSSLAIDAARIQNRYEDGEGVFGGSDAYLSSHKHYFRNAEANNAGVRALGGFTLLGLNTQGPPWLIEDAAQKRFLPLIPAAKKCAEHIHMTSVESWCPRTLLDVAQLGSYYNQISINRAYLDNSSSFPMAFYLDAADYDGTIRTGSQLLDGYQPPNSNDEHKSDAYAYVDTVLAYNVQRVCLSDGKHQTTDDDDDACSSLRSAIQNRRISHPVSTWYDGNHGRRDYNEIDLESF